MKRYRYYCRNRVYSGAFDTIRAAKKWYETHGKELASMNNRTLELKSFEFVIKTPLK